MKAILIQARTDSVRLPRKVLKELPEGSGVSVLARVIRRAKKAKNVDVVIVVSQDLPVIEIAQAEGVLYSRYLTEERDVLAEFYQAARIYGVSVIVRITADCPCIMPDTIDKMVEYFQALNCDLLYNRNDNLDNCTEIDGLDIEVFTFNALEIAHKQATLPFDREHVTMFMHYHLPFNCEAMESGWSADNAEIKLSIDNHKDYCVVCKMYKALGTDFNTRDIIKYFREKDNAG